MRKNKGKSVYTGWGTPPAPGSKHHGSASRRGAERTDPGESPARLGGQAARLAASAACTSQPALRGSLPI